MLKNHTRNPEFKISYYGWIVVGMAGLSNLVGFGLVYSYGVFLKPLASEYAWSRSAIMGAFSVYAIAHNVLAFFLGGLVDRYGPKIVFAIGGFCLGLSMIFMSYVTSLWDLYIYYGLIFSVGIAATYTPAMATVSLWFKDKRGLALGLTAAGIGLGSFIFMPLSAYVTLTYGWRMSYIILGIIAWAIFIPIVLFVRKAPPEVTKIRSELESKDGLSFTEAFKTRTFWAFIFSWMFAATALWSILMHIVPLATDRGIPLMKSGILAGLIGGSSIIGRICGGFLSDNVGRKAVFTGACVFQLIVTGGLLFCNQVWMLFIFAVLFGLSSGGWAGVMPAFPGDYFGNRATGSILGFAVFAGGIGVAAGPYLGAYIFDTTQSYNYMIAMTIFAIFAGIISASFIKPVNIAEKE